MKGLLSKEHYCYKIHTLMERCAPPSIDSSMAYPSYLRENLDPPPSMIFQPPGGLGSHYDDLASGVLRQNERPLTVRVSKLGLGKKLHSMFFLLFAIA